MTAGGIIARTGTVLAIALGVIITLVIAGVGVLLALMTGQTGRDLIESFVDGREIAGIEVRLSQLSGNPLDRLVVGHLTLSDEEGVWLTIEDLVIDWRPRDLLNRTVTLDELSARWIGIARQPVLPESEDDDEPGGDMPVQVRILDLSIGEIELAEAVAGQSAVLTAAGRLGGVDGVWRAALEVERLDAPGDRISLNAEIGDRFQISAEMDAASGGPIAGLLQAPEADIAVRAQADGTVHAGAGRIDLTIDGRTGLEARLDWSDNLLRADGRADSSAWAAFETIAEILGGPAAFTASLPYGDDGLTNPDLNGLQGAVRSPNLDVRAVRAGEQALDLQVREAANLVSFFAGDILSVGSLSGQGRLAFSEQSLSFDGNIAATDLDLGQARFDAVTGPISVSGPPDSPEILAELRTRGAGFEIEQAGQLLGEAPSATVWISWDNEAGRLDIAEAVVTGADESRIAVAGMVDVSGERFDIDLDAAGLPLGRFTDLIAGNGAIRGEASGGFDGSASFTGAAQGRGLSGDLADRLGPEVDITIDGARRADGAIMLTELYVRSEALLVEATGESAGEDWSIAGDLAWSGGAPVAAVVLEGSATIAFEAASTAGVLAVRAEAAADTVGAGPVLIDDARLRVEGGGPLEAFEGSWLLTGATEGGPVDIGGRAARRGEAVQLTGVDGRFGGLLLEGGLTAQSERIEARFAAAPVSGFGRADIDFTLAEGRIDARVEAEDLVGGDLQTLDSLLLIASGPVEAINFELAAEGTYGAGARVRAEGLVETGDEGGRVRAELDARYGAVQIGTIQPIEASFGGDDGVRATGALSLDEGRISWDASLSDMSSINVDLDRAPIALLSSWRGTEPLLGALSGDVRLDRIEDIWRGEIALVADRITPAERAEDPDNIVFLNADLRVVLDAAGAALTLAAQGADLDAQAQISVASGPVSDFGQLGEASNALSGSASVRGEITGLAAFQLSESQILSGDALVEARIGGTVGAPDLDGTARLTGGRFTDEALGLALNDIELAARFFEDALELESLTATGSDGGSLTGAGRLSFGGGALTGEAQIRFDDFTLIEQDDLVAEGDGTVEIVLAEDGIDISGETRLARVEARPPEGGGQQAIPIIPVRQINVPGGREDLVPRRPGPPVRLDYRVVAPARVFVRAQQFDTEWALDLHVGGTTESIALNGELRLLRGRADLLGRAFDFERGVVRLSGDPMDAALDIVASRQAREITAQIQVGGTVRAPQITLASNPSLPQDEIASRLLFDQGAGQLTGLQAAQLAAAVASMRGGGGGFDPFTALRTATGLDQLSVGADADGQTVVTGGRYLTDDVYLEVESGGAATSTTRIEWRLTRNLTLLSRLTGGGEAGVAVTWRREYD